MQVSTMLVGWGWQLDQFLSAWQEVEQLGFDACYMGDDLFPHTFGDDDRDADCFDPWTVLPAVAVQTSRMRIGTTVSPAGRRHPGLFAKSTSLIDRMSNGRLIVGMGAGNAPAQQRSVGQPFLEPKARVALLREELEILRGMWTQDRTTLKGEVWQVEEAINQPKPISQPYPEVLIGFKAPKLVAPLVAEFAKRANVFAGDDAALAHILDVVRGECTKIGRTFEDIIFSRCASIILTDGPVTDRARVIEERAMAIGMNPEFLAGEHDALLSYVGPVSGCADYLHLKTAAMGIEEVIVLIDTIDKNSFGNTMTGLRAFARDVLPDLQSRETLAR